MARMFIYTVSEKDKKGSSVKNDRRGKESENHLNYHPVYWDPKSNNIVPLDVYAKKLKRQSA